MSSLKTITAVIALLAAIYYLKFNPKPGKVVVTKSGLVSGIISVSRDGREFYEWLGIPYATPPVGKLRFAGPRPVKPWDTVRDASSYGSWCLQTYGMFLIRFGHEDCLFLNIHVPKMDDSSKLLPVMVFIHGGAFFFGNSQEYRPDYFMDHDVVLVTINYRLGVFGFLSAGNESLSGNMGLKDQALALKWIHKNVRAFGGDDNRITLFGQSAGAGSTIYQIFSSENKGIIRKAIALSGSGVTGPWMFTSPDKAILKSKQIAEHFHCPTDNPAMLRKCLQQVPASELLSAVQYDVREHFIFYPHRNGHPDAPTAEYKHPEAFLTQHPLQILEQGTALKIPLLVGVTADEGLISAFSFYKNPTNMKFFEDNWDDRVGDICSLTRANKSEVAKAIKDFYFPPEKTLTYEDKLKAFTNLFGDCTINFGVHNFAEVQRRFSPVYLYYFNIHGGPSASQALTDFRDIFHPLFDFGLSTAKMYVKEILLGIPREDVGVMHCDDIVLAFPIITNTQKGDEFYNLSKSWVKFLVDFATDKHVSFMGEELEAVSEQGPLLYLELSNQAKILSPPFVPRVEFLRSVGFQSEMANVIG